MLQTIPETGKPEDLGTGHDCLEIVNYEDPEAVYWRVKKGLEPALRCRADVFRALKDLEKLAMEDEVFGNGGNEVTGAVTGQATEIDDMDELILTYVDVFAPDRHDGSDTIPARASAVG